MDEISHVLHLELFFISEPSRLGRHLVRHVLECSVREILFLVAFLRFELGLVRLVRLLVKNVLLPVAKHNNREVESNRHGLLFEGHIFCLFLMSDF